MAHGRERGPVPGPFPGHDAQAVNHEVSTCCVKRLRTALCREHTCWSSKRLPLRRVIFGAMLPAIGKVSMSMSRVTPSSQISNGIVSGSAQAPMSDCIMIPVAAGNRSTKQPRFQSILEQFERQSTKTREFINRLVCKIRSEWWVPV